MAGGKRETILWVLCLEDQILEVSKHWVPGSYQHIGEQMRLWSTTVGLVPLIMFVSTNFSLIMRIQKICTCCRTVDTSLSSSFPKFWIEASRVCTVESLNIYWSWTANTKCASRFLTHLDSIFAEQRMAIWSLRRVILVHSRYLCCRILVFVFLLQGESRQNEVLKVEEWFEELFRRSQIVTTPMDQSHNEALTGNETLTR